MLGAAAAALTLILRFEERRRTFAIAAALGARPRHLRALVSVDAVLLGVFGLACGAAIAGSVAAMLVTLLNGVFDPPPQHLTLPWWYLGVLGAVTIAAIAAATWITIRAARRAPLAVLRGL